MARTSLIERKAVAQKFEWVSVNCKRIVRHPDALVFLGNASPIGIFVSRFSMR
ncbi:hypothetical protein RISK_000029 [Rhodopirellula islandica]|uniref:Uncharacterized protein n=1 Tax=Rhodopirellula islandica TaxID=595434 RepID=A0A0J1BMX9_RHOIS|nr:hypothetical protein RISK_000029 [Rhodopirellula islandica]